jgi:hypothetical protein
MPKIVRLTKYAKYLLQIGDGVPISTISVHARGVSLKAAKHRLREEQPYHF